MPKPRVAPWLAALLLATACGTTSQAVTAPESAGAEEPPLGGGEPSAGEPHDNPVAAPEPADLPAPGAGAALTPRDAARDPRVSTRTPRSPALVATEITGLETLLASTPRSAPDRPALMRRLAEDYVELESGQLGGGGLARALAASDQALRYYGELQRDYPSYPLLDEVLYFLGYEEELRGDLMGARRSYFELIQKFPSSRYVPHAYYGFGDMFLNEAKTDSSKAQLAVEAFKKVLQFPPTPIAPYAYLRVGAAYDLMNDRAHAAEAYRRVLRDYPASDAAQAVPSWVGSWP